MKKKPLKVYGLPSEVLERLSLISERKYGNSNVSHLARDLLLQAAEEPTDTTDMPVYVNGSEKTRMELKLPPKIAAWLESMANKQFMSSNMVALAILLEHI
ncbi:hypothetical protein, partial [Neisseria dumasiana]